MQRSYWLIQRWDGVHTQNMEKVGWEGGGVYLEVYVVSVLLKVVQNVLFHAGVLIFI